MNPYEVLGVDRDVDDDEVKEAYRELAKEHHPDRGGDEEKFKEIQEAYDQITSEDGFSPEGGFDGQNPFAARGAAQGFNFDEKDKNVEDFIRDFQNFASKGGFSRRGFQGSPFGGGRTRQKVVYELPIDFRTAVYGDTVEVRTSGPEELGEKHEIEIPAGVKNGTKLDYNGNLTVKFIVNNNTSFWRENGNDIYTVRKVSAWDAMVGESLEIETLDGQKVRLKLDPGTSSGEVFRLKDFGGPPTFNGDPQGDMYVEISVDVPAVTEEENIELINQLRNEER